MTTFCCVVFSASMRPRPEDRGERPTTRRRWNSVSAASMRPRPEDRGEQDRRGRTRLEQEGFNAATARRPWRTKGSPTAHDATHEASMRPRPEDRGEPAIRGGPTSGADGFNAATARRPWRTSRRERSLPQDIAMLQCGHGPKTVENLIAGTPCVLSRDWCFNAATARRPWRTTRTPRMIQPRTCASMRPRPEDRGEPDRVTALLITSSASFNAATARRPWRTGLTSHKSGRPCPLQCGHGPKTVENQLTGRRATSRR